MTLYHINLGNLNETIIKDEIIKITCYCICEKLKEFLCTLLVASGLYEKRIFVFLSVKMDLVEVERQEVSRCDQAKLLLI